MEQVNGDLFSYSVSAGETVTLAITPIGVGNFASVVIDGVPRARAFSYLLTADGPSGREHNIVLECEFPGITDADARYDITVTGSAGGSPFSFSIKNSNTLKEAAFRFTVR
ncbi:MAG TPA: hypothetical protein VEM96_01355 [Pyrinomonadaceae bacterium]|nr:hypothetical protein [Pyrinomonadaceae bacterium]